VGLLNRSLLTILVAGILGVPAAARGGLSYVSQVRSVTASAGPESMKSSLAVGQFTADVNSEGFASDGSRSSTRASQISSLNGNTMAASGRVTAGAGLDAAEYDALVDVVFTVPTSIAYQVSSSLEFQVAHPNGILDPQSSTYSLLALTLRRTGTSGEVLVDEKRNQGQVFFEEEGVVGVSRSGTLVPGTYALRFALHSRVFSDSEDGTYQFDFRVGSGNPSAVPLPSAAWMTLLTLCGIAGNRVWATRPGRSADGALDRPR
jgi:hypothetical protein